MEIDRYRWKSRKNRYFNFFQPISTKFFLVNELRKASFGFVLDSYDPNRQLKEALIFRSLRGKGKGDSGMIGELEKNIN
jgi:hypothetical protein